MDYQINTTKLVTVQSDLEQTKNSISQKNPSFKAGAFHSTGNLSRALWKIGVTFKNIEKNLENINLYLKEYVEDISNYENGSQGNVGLANVALRENQSLIKSQSFSYEMSSSKLFSIKRVSESQNTSFKNNFGPASLENDEASSIIDFSIEGSDENNFPYLDLEMPDFNLDLFDFNLDELQDFNMSDFSVGDFLNSVQFDFSSFGHLSMASIGSVDFSAFLFSPIHWDTNIIKNLSPLGNLNLSSIEKNFVSVFDDSQKMVLKDFLAIKGIDISSFDGLTDLKTLDLSKLDISQLQFNHDLVNFIEHQVAMGKITDMNALNLLHQLFPNTINLNLKRYCGVI